MPELSLSKKQIEFIKANRLTMSATDMAKKFKVDKTVVNRYMRKNGLSVPFDIVVQFRTKSLQNITSATAKEDRYLKANYLTIPCKRIATNLKRSDVFVKTRLRQLGLVIPKEIIEQRKIDSRIKPGHIPANKGKKMSAELKEKTKHTFFQKGNLPKNTKDRDGVISIRYEHPERNGGRPYKYVRVSLGKWVPLHQHIWEKKHGKPSEGMCLWFKDGDSLNCTLKNLELITRAENARRNRAKFLEYPEELKQNIITLSLLKRKIKQHGKK